MSVRPLRIALLGSSRYPVRQPFSGGLEAFVFELAHGLTAEGHSVTVFAAADSDVGLPWNVVPLRTLEMSDATRRLDPTTPEWMVAETHAYLSVMVSLARAELGAFDVIHNHSPHYLPLAMAHTVDAPMLTTLHTPPLKWMEQAVLLPGGVASSFVAVSEFTARQWKPISGPIPVILNGVDIAHRPMGPGGGYAVWTGRLVPEKGVTSAIAAARAAGMPLRIAGPIGDTAYFDAAVRPLLGDGPTGAVYDGHLRRDDLNALVGGAAVALVTPHWDEPYGRVVAEALAAGTPVAAFARGGIPEIVDRTCGRLAAPGDIGGLSRAMLEARTLRRADARARAERCCSHDVMVAQYLDLYRQLTCQPLEGVSA
ncbi:glycosyltransferase family 4 protein [Mycolicibacterium sp. 018/SC-01/001]|uniref:glycosyltransferase n=1 Tax=Mycolicibacterium sp. 018/SC-01/001 TaxID=2592069 RepID=UPI00118009EB|nr:glycosyltransferase [Mycolicibacterium sp. 018/SC-01/001]TRW82794.1 glycosyltransferase family 4 protein [Mycolicibacterium sp. 018/SC-01/001]